MLKITKEIRKGKDIKHYKKTEVVKREIQIH